MYILSKVNSVRGEVIGTKMPILACHCNVVYVPAYIFTCSNKFISTNLLALA